MILSELTNEKLLEIIRYKTKKSKSKETVWLNNNTLAGQLNVNRTSLKYRLDKLVKAGKLKKRAKTSQYAKYAITEE